MTFWQNFPVKKERIILPSKFCHYCERRGRLGKEEERKEQGATHHEPPCSLYPLSNKTEALNGLCFRHSGGWGKEPSLSSYKSHKHLCIFVPCSSSSHSIWNWCPAGLSADVCVAKYATLTSIQSTSKKITRSLHPEKWRKAALSMATLLALKILELHTPIVT